LVQGVAIKREKVGHNLVQRKFGGCKSGCWRNREPASQASECVCTRGKQPAQHKHPLIEDECRHSLASGSAALFPALAHMQWQRQFFPGGSTAQKLICHFSKVDTHQGGCGMNKTQRLCTAIIIHGDLY